MMKIKKYYRKLLHCRPMFDEIKVENDSNDNIEEKVIKYQEIINKYHYTFISNKKYKLSKTLRVSPYLFLALAVFFIYNYVAILMNEGFGSSLETLGIESYLSYIIFFVFTFLFAIIDIDNAWKVRLQLFKNYQHIFQHEDMPFKFKNSKKLTKKIQKEWLGQELGNVNPHELAKDISSWQDLMRKHQTNKTVDLIEIIVNGSSTNRVISLLIALFTITTAFLVKSLTSDEIFNILDSIFLILYWALLKLGFAFFVLGYVIYYQGYDLRVFIEDLFHDFTTDNEKMPNNARINRFIQVLLREHSYTVRVLKNETNL